MPLQGAHLLTILPRAVPWAISCCPCGAYYLTTSHSSTIQPHYFAFQHHTTSLLRIPTPYNLTTSHSNTITHYIHIPPCEHACSDGRRCKEQRMFTDIHGCVGAVPWGSVAMTIAIVAVATQGHGSSVPLRVNPLRCKRELSCCSTPPAG